MYSKHLKPYQSWLLVPYSLPILYICDWVYLTLRRGKGEGLRRWMGIRRAGEKIGARRDIWQGFNARRVKDRRALSVFSDHYDTLFYSIFHCVFCHYCLFFFQVVFMLSHIQNIYLLLVHICLTAHKVSVPCITWQINTALNAIRESRIVQLKLAKSALVCSSDTTL